MAASTVRFQAVLLAPGGCFSGLPGALAFGQEVLPGCSFFGGQALRTSRYLLGQFHEVARETHQPVRIVGPEFFAFVQHGGGAGPVTAVDAAIQEQNVAAVKVDAEILHLGRSIQNAALDGHGFLERGPGFVAAAQCELGLADLHPGVG
jgi:hypothetical protein